VAAVLYEAQIASERAGDAILADTLAAARQICLAGDQCRAEVEWHRRACEKADQREQELRQQIYSILDLIGGRGAPKTREVPARSSSASTVEVGMLERDAPQTIESPSLWQRVQTLLGRRTSPQSPESESPIVSVESLATSPTEKKEGPLPPSLAVYCLGAFRAYQDDQLIADWNGLKARSIFKYLLAHRGAPVVKDILMDLFWPDADPEAARRNLHQAIYSLRRTLRQGQPDFQHIQFENDCYLLNPETDIWVASEEFEKHVQVGRRLEAAGRFGEAMAAYGIAEGLYLGDFLKEDLYEDWSSLQRERMRNMYLDIADRLSEHYVGRGEYTAATALCQKVLAQDNCYEGAHRRLMRCYLAQGQRHLAVRQYQTCVETLKEELELAPSEETVTLYRHITTA